ncbi:MAG: VOC family protein [Pseudomonadota bacterium]|jgi:catechol 2,3-dioxygenase-like lactoylglutathione lyase family enzyme
MFSYICLGTNDPKRSRVFYDTVLATLGQTRCTTPGEEFGDWSGWGQYAQEGVVQLALWLCPPFDGAPAQPGNGVMVALRALSTDAVDGFHRVALASGGSCAGAPGWRPQYNADFYAAYIFDPDGNKLAAVCRGSPSARATTG